ncbi:SHOCT domain-containing protein [Piscibacillus salipiscarius]|uniref:SHOCT domain-containing protein n=1 Tax=Piscibacillus salipiscarius TaxID=299480 RepID=A0ABW5Q6S9_9BACI|nr:SHOCT domain-containing protein [Piscibacillus salipiscarius]
MNGGMMNGDMGGNLFGGFFFSLIMIVLIVLIIVVLIWMFRNPSDNHKQTNQSQDSLEILKSRLAKGEITEEEYERLKDKINH